MPVAVQKKIMFAPFNFLSVTKHLGQINEGKVNHPSPYKTTSVYLNTYIHKYTHT